MSKRVAVISDTHGLLRPELLEQITGCDAIIHAGDVDEPEVLERLKSIAPVYVVRGNNDWEWAAAIPRTLRFQIEKCRFFLTHNRVNVPKVLFGIDVVIFGHTHQYFEQKVNGRLFLNPGSCGWAAFGREITFAFLTIDARDISVQKLILPDR